MANVLSLAMKIGADASGFKLDPVTRALRSLGDEVTKVSSVFTKFAGTSEAAAQAQEEVTRKLQSLIEARRADQVGVEEFERQFKAITDAAREQAAAFEEGAQLTERFRTEEEKRASALQRVSELLQQKAIDEQTAARATAEFSGANAAAAQAEKQLASDQQAAARIREANLTTLERAQRNYDTAIAEARRLESLGILTKADLNRETERQAQILGKVKSAADGAAAAAKGQTLQFNELSGIFSALPGPLGSIAGRISGLSSAGEGLARVFSGGLSQGLSSVASSVTALINPFTVATAGIGAFAAAAVAVTQGLIALEDRVEKLGNTADKLGLSFEFIQVLDEAARRSGTSIDAVSAAFGRLQRSVLGVDEESKAAQKALAEIGVTAEDLQRLNPQEQYILIGQSLAGIEDPARRTATAVALFGRAGADLIPFFNNIKGAADDFERVGNALSEAQRRDIDAFGASMDRLGVATRGAKESLLAEFAPAATQTANTFATAAGVVSRNSGLIADALSATVNNFTGGLPAAISGLSAAVSGFGEGANAADEATKATQQNVKETAEQVEEAARQADALQKAFDASGKTLDDAINKAGEYGQAGFNAALQFQNAIQDLQDQVAEKELTAEQYSRGVANATKEFERQISLARQVADENKRLAEEAKRRADAEAAAIQKIIDAKANEIPQIEQDLNAVEAEIARVEAAAVAAYGVGRDAEATTLMRRLAELDQLQAGLQQQADEAAQGFSEGFDAAFANVNNGIGSLIDKASEFGQEGFNAALQLQDGIAKAQEQVKDGILNKQAFDAEVARQKELFENRVADLRRAEEITKRIGEQQQQLADRQFEIDLERAQELATVRSGSIQINDLREGGISAFFDALKEDPAISEARKQTKELENIRRELAKLQAEKVDILAGNG